MSGPLDNQRITFDSGNVLKTDSAKRQGFRRVFAECEMSFLPHSELAQSALLLNPGLSRRQTWGEMFVGPLASAVESQQLHTDTHFLPLHRDGTLEQRRG